MALIREGFEKRNVKTSFRNSDVDETPIIPRSVRNVRTTVRTALAQAKAHLEVRE
ncbi:hypothetical protein [Thermococcus sp.]|uniref:hypothetical protein n=1 Tax=Thermococcus sp. TaxID=35749 RepID=UPI002625CD2C|nr:hypothetical protein [Thermococcus sp.]